ncbi:MAG: VCBS repeat-containing protein, partial [Caldilinea sp.]|nr:VCBS repeat-containing protein [Caldilinea sp.]
MTPPAVQLPKGGGAIRGMGEKFAANPVTGTGSMSVPIATSPGRSGFGPQLSLSYDSGAGNGPFGFGWNLSLPSIARKTDKGLPRYLDGGEIQPDSDVFILSGAEDLVPMLVQKDSKWVREEVAPQALNGKTYRIGRYRPRIEGLFARIERWTNQADPADVFWRSISKDNVTTWYGKTAESRIIDPADQTRIFSWLICQSYDDKGNAIVYEYAPEDDRGVDRSQANERNRVRTANCYLKRIKYGNRSPNRDIATWQPTDPTQLPGDTWMFEAVFDYDEQHIFNETTNAGQQIFVEASAATSQDWTRRLDPFSSYRAGFEVRTYRLCQRVLMFHHFPGEADVGQDCLVRSTDFSYSYEENPEDARNPIFSFLLSVEQCGYKRQNGVFLKRSLPPLEFEYTQPAVQEAVEEINAESLANLPIGVDGAAYQWTDLHGEGIPGILTEQAGAWFYKRNLSPINEKTDNGKTRLEAQFSSTELLAARPNLGLAGGAQFMDLAGDGQPDLVVLDGPMPGYYEHDGDEGWQPFRLFTSRLNHELRDPNLKFVDLNGDGHADVLITEDDAFVWHVSLAEEGFGPASRVAQALDEESGPRLVFADGTQSIYLADLSGDGLTDLARIRSGEVCYWPNLGYGRFGAKVTMDNAPWFDYSDQFSQQRIRLADIDGSGTTDIIYLGGQEVSLYFNQSGNSWSEAHPIPFPAIDNLAAVQAVDLLGNGTACLVWSSPLPGSGRRSMRYLDLMGGQKPHLLVKTVNNLGAETRVNYVSSTKFYLRDKRDGKPWITRLPFPVHVVERVETFDRISRNRFVTRYAYHHGYFDGEEREFRGFGMVEQTDTEAFAALTASGDLPVGDNVDAHSHIPPLLTRTWFHTGVYVGRDHVTDFFAGLLDIHDRGEYYRGPACLDDDDEARERLLPDTILPSGLTLDEEREAARSLKGMMLRQEVYAQDGVGVTSDFPNGQPYTVAEQNFTVRPLQPRDGNRHAVFFTHPREAITYHYEREPQDPRIQHALTLEVDGYGNVLTAAAIGYGRRVAATDPALLPEDHKKQRLIHITVTENSYTNVIALPDAYRTPLPAEASTYELRRSQQDETRAGSFTRYPFHDMLRFVHQAGDGAHDIAYEDIAYERAIQAVAADAAEGQRYFRRLIERVRTLYRPDDCGVTRNDPLTLLALGVLESLALPGESYKLAFTPGLLDQVYERTGLKLLLPDAAAILGGAGPDRGGYVDLDSDDHWWIPSGRPYLSSNSRDDASTELAQARQHFFLPRRYCDPFGQDALVDFDAHDLLMAETRDALGNRVTVDVNDYCVLQPRLVSDPNRNRSEVAFDALGMVVGTAVMGKPTPAPVEGDKLTGFVADLAQTDLDAFFDAADPHAAAPGLLRDATTRIVYDLDRFRRTQQAHPEDSTRWQAACAATLARETHVSAPLPPPGLKIQLSFSYSDGFGREIQKKIQAEGGKVPQSDAEGKIIVGPDNQPVMTPNDVSPRWVGSGWTVFNNKGKPVRQYEPFFTDTHRFEFDVKIGVSPVLFYDPAERVVVTLHPNHTYEKVVFDPWQQTTHDVNDTCAPRNQETGDPRTDPDIWGYVAEYFKTQPAIWQTWHAQRIGGALGPHEQAAATRAADHADTPIVVHFDALSRPFLTIAHNRFLRETPAGAIQTIEEKYATRVELDIEGNQCAVRDADQQHGDPLGRIVMRYDYDMLGNRIHQLSMEAGARWMLNDVVGKPIRAWDSRGHNFTTTYDALRRPVEQRVRGTTPESDPRTLNSELLVDKIEYGEPPPNPTPAQDALAQSLNLRTRIYRHFDSAGVATNALLDANGSPVEAYDFKGNLLRSTRRLARNYTAVPDWSQPSEPQLDAETFVGSTRYDALNRPIQSVAPYSSLTRAGHPNKFNIIQPVFNEANLLERVDVWLERATEPSALLDPAAETPSPVGVANIDYDPKGQRLRIEYKNGATTHYRYDPDTFRLVHLYTRRSAAFTADCDNPAPPPSSIAAPEQPPAGVACGLQNLHYTYDPAGNITHIQDDAQQTIFFKNQIVEPSNDYTYDAVYRLIEATGREHLGQ